VQDEEEDSRPATATVAREEPAARALPVERVEMIDGQPVRRAEPVLEEEIITAQPQAPRINRRPRRMNGLEVRPAEPVYEPAPGPGLPRRAERARYLGTTPEGELVFEVPSAERGYVSPRP
jgi:hypothetical protein